MPKYTVEIEEVEDELPTNRHFWSLAELEALALVNTEFWLDRFPKGEVTILAGEPEAGKTFAALAFVHAILEIDNEAKALWIDLEAAGPDTREKAQVQGVDHDRLFFLGQKFGSGFDTSYDLGGSRSDQRVLESTLASLGTVRIVVVDSLMSLSPGADTNNTDFGNKMSAVKRIVCDRYDAALIWLTHMNKSNHKDDLRRLVGSGQIRAKTRVIYLLMKEGKSKTRRVMQCLKFSYACKARPGELYMEVAGPGTPVRFLEGVGSSEMEEKVALLQPNIMYLKDELKAMWGLSMGDFNRVLKEALENQKIVQFKRKYMKEDS